MRRAPGDPKLGSKPKQKEIVIHDQINGPTDESEPSLEQPVFSMHFSKNSFLGKCISPDMFPQARNSVFSSKKAILRRLNKRKST